MSTPAGVLLLVVAVIAVVGIAGTIWAMRALPQPRRRRRRRSAGRTTGTPRPQRPPASAARVVAAPPERSVAQSDQDRIEAMRALLHRGDERARRLAAENPDQPAFADTQALDDDEPPPLPLNWSTPAKPPKPPGSDSGHIPL